MDRERYILDGLNGSQTEAVTAADGPLMVVAGPGTGKTLTIVRKIAYLVNCGIDPGHIAAVTFTNRAAQEMKERTAALLGKDATKVFIGTFHMMGLQIIRDNTPQDLVICTRDEQANLLKAILKDQGRKIHETIDKISRIKNLLEDVDEDIRVVYEQYRSLLNEKNALDLDDLILKPIGLLRDASMLQRYRDRLRHIIVDEYQDINRAQYELLMLLAGDNGNICVVGDPDQAIYAFRGADVTNFLNFEKDFPGAGKVVLAHNYRSTAAIIKASDNMIRSNQRRIKRELFPLKETGKQIVIASVPDEKTEGEFIVNEIEARIGGTSHYRLMNAPHRHDLPETACSFSDFAVIYRTNAQAEIIGEAFRSSGIPFQVTGSRRLAEKRTYSEIIDTLKDRAADTGPAAFTKASSIEELFRSALSELGIGDDGLLCQLLMSIVPCNDAPTIQTFNDAMNMVRLLLPADDFDPRADSVALMTLHMAKGLEFKVVFIAGVEDGLIPYAFRDEHDDAEEERRLFYVGMTRAKEELFLVHARQRFLYGRDRTPQPSPFIGEIPEIFTQKVTIPDKIKKPKKKQMKLF
jgi:superfamily I DNA/RNA helicase